MVLQVTFFDVLTFDLSKLPLTGNTAISASMLWQYHSKGNWRAQLSLPKDINVLDLLNQIPFIGDKVTTFVDTSIQSSAAFYVSLLHILLRLGAVWLGCGGLGWAG